MYGVSKYPMYIIDDYEYSRDKVNSGRPSYRCRFKRKYNNCPARFTLENDGDIRVGILTHSHEPTFNGDYKQCQVEIANFLYRKRRN